MRSTRDGARCTHSSTVQKKPADHRDDNALSNSLRSSALTVAVSHVTPHAATSVRRRRLICHRPCPASISANAAAAPSAALCHPSCPHECALSHTRQNSRTSNLCISGGLVAIREAEERAAVAMWVRDRTDGRPLLDRPGACVRSWAHACSYMSALPETCRHNLCPEHAHTPLGAQTAPYNAMAGCPGQQPCHHGDHRHRYDLEGRWCLNVHAS